MATGSGFVFLRLHRRATVAALVDVSGAVIGIVIGKSPNENLNYSLPITIVLDAPTNKATFDTRYLQSLPYLHGTLTHSLKADSSAKEVGCLRDCLLGIN